MTIEFGHWPENPVRSFQVTKILGLASLGFADVTEIFEACKRIDPESDDSWIREWLATSRAVEKHGRDAEATGNWLSARNAYCRACNYNRVAEFLIEAQDTRKIDLLKKTSELFDAASCYFDVVPEKVQIDYEGVKLEGYFFAPPWVQEPRATVLSLNGGDCQTTENYFNIGPALIQSGYNFFIYDQPGTGLSLYEKGKPRRADAEHFHSKAVDFLASRPEVDASKIIVFGESFSGYDSLRLASQDPRLAAVISNGGPHKFNWGEMLKWMPPSYAAHAMHILGAESLDDFANDPRFNYNLDGFVEKIECPLLVMHGVEEVMVQPNPLHQALTNYQQAGTSNKSFVAIEDRRLGGLEHCQVDNRNVTHEVVLNWLCSIGLGPAAPRGMTEIVQP